VASGVRIVPRVEKAIPSDPLAEADEKTPVSMPVFEDLPTGRDALADHRLPMSPMLAVTGPAARPAAPAAASPAQPEPGAAGLEAAPTTLLPQLRRGPLPGLVRESAAATPRAPADFEADPAVPTKPARISEVERIEAQYRGSEPTVSAPGAPDGAVRYEDQGDGIAATDDTDCDDRARPPAEAPAPGREETTPPEGTPTLMAVQAGASEPAGSKLATVAMPQMTLPITPIKPDDASVTMRQIIVVGPKPRR
jgi:hypothetical protein